MVAVTALKIATSNEEGRTAARVKSLLGLVKDTNDLLSSFVYFMFIVG